jgi:long-chain acyl-CoA synthetase
MASTSVSAPSSAPLAGSRTAPALWQHALSAGRTTPAYLAEGPDGWSEVSWAEAGRRVDALARGLAAHGVGHGDVVAILARTSLEWALLDWAVMSLGAVVVGLYPTSSPSEIEYILGHSEAVLVFVEDDEQLAKVDAVRSALPQLRETIRFADLGRVEADGAAHEGPLPDVSEDDLATLIYTSGTTGPPKGCMLTHRNLVVAATKVDTGLTGDADVVLLFLPMAHSFGRLVHQSGAFHAYTTAFVADPARTAEALERVRPTVLPAVPRVYEKIHAGVVSQLEEAGGAKRAIGLWAIAIGRRAAALRREGKPVPLTLRLRERVADKLVFSKVREKLGGRLRLGISGAAPIAPDALEFFHALGLLVLEGYGMTENSSSATVNRPDRFRFGSVGQAVTGCELRLDDDGELLVRSETVFAGYFKDEAATRSALTEDGWLRTGDIAQVDADGFVRIVDRKKDLIITAGGKNIAPQNLENALTASRFVSQALVVGDRRPYIVALVALDDAAVAASGRDPEQLVQELVDDVNRDRTRVEQIKKFAILPRELSLEEGEITPTMKLKRRVVEEHFAAQIDALYDA